MSDQIRAVTFDARGTLLKVRFPVGETYAAVARRHGAVLSPDSVDAAFFEVFPTMPALAFPPMPEAQLHEQEQGWWRTLVGRVVESAGGIDDFDSFFRELFGIYRGAQAWKPYREAASVLCLLRSSRIKLGLISNFDSRIEEVLVALTLSIWFDVVPFSSRVGVAKPEPQIFHEALGELGVDVGAALHVGDSLRKDYRGARAVGMQSLLVDRAGQYREDAEIDTVESLEGVLTRLDIAGYSRFARAHAS